MQNVKLAMQNVKLIRFKQFNLQTDKSKTNNFPVRIR